MRCRMREREGARPVVRCVPIRVVLVPRNCSELECSDGFMCVIMDGKAMCVETPSPPDECDRLACEERNQECRVITFFNVTRAICGPISDCSRLSCNESEGLECRVAGEGQMKFAFCARTSNCSKLICNESEGLECRVAGEGVTRFAFCARTSNCSRISCDESQGLECRVVGEGVSAVAVCLITRNCTVLNPICRRRGLVCQEPQDEGDFAQATCVQATSCEELECNPGFVCQEFTLEESGDGENSGVVSSGSGVLPSTVPPSSPSATQQPTDASASGSGSTSVIFVSTSGPVISTSPPSPQSVARCVSNNIRASCNELVCEEDQVCSLVRYPSRNISIARCVGHDTVPQPQLFELGTVCEGRTAACPVGTECLEVDGNMAGTLCNTPPNVISCDNLECTSIAECVQSEVDGIPVLAFCLSSATVDTVVSSILTLLP